MNLNELLFDTNNVYITQNSLRYNKYFSAITVDLFTDTTNNAAPAVRKQTGMQSSTGATTWIYFHIKTKIELFYVFANTLPCKVHRMF